MKPFSALYVPDPREVCPLCRRRNCRMTRHHLVPKSRGGRRTEWLCRDCHRAIHVLFANRELEQQHHTVEALLAHPELAKMVRFIARQNGRVKMGHAWHTRSKRRH
jgi:hypothetical protein